MSKDHLLPLASAVIFVALILVSVPVAIGFLALNILLGTTIGLTRISVARKKKYPMPTPGLRKQPKVSIHVPCYNEPPELLIATLNSLAKLDYENYEVIVLDNNTPDPEVYLPVQKHCATLGSKFRFYHYSNVRGYKAGALNIAHTLTAEDAEFILVIDADYVLEPNLLQRALPHFRDPEVGLVQFPQAYLNTGSRNSGLQAEYEHFFSVYMNMANHCNCVLATGTVCFIRREALEAAGLWFGKSITEDVELGLNIKRAGYKGIYVPEPLGRGLMPTDLSSLSVQRERWVYGNMQTLIDFLKDVRNYPPGEIRTIVLFLTAWFNFLLLPMLALVVLCVAVPLGYSPESARLIGGVAAAGIGLELLLSLVFFLSIRRSAGFGSTEKKLAAYLTHLGLSFEGAINWIKVPLFPNMPFKRTNKFLSLGISGLRLSKAWIFAAVLLLSAMLLFTSAPGLLFLCVTAAVLLLGSAYYLTRQIEATRHESELHYESSASAGQSMATLPLSIKI